LDHLDLVKKQTLVSTVIYTRYMTNNKTVSTISIYNYFESKS
jgi:hypothetical protein